MRREGRSEAVYKNAAAAGGAGAPKAKSKAHATNTMTFFLRAQLHIINRLADVFS